MEEASNDSNKLIADRFATGLGRVAPQHHVPAPFTPKATKAFSLAEAGKEAWPFYVLAL